MVVVVVKSKKLGADGGTTLNTTLKQFDLLTVVSGEP